MGDALTRKNLTPLATNAIQAWASERFLPGEANGEFFQGSQKRFFQGGPKVVELHFAHSKLRKQPFLLKL